VNRFRNPCVRIGLALGLVFIQTLVVQVASLDLALARPQSQARANPRDSACDLYLNQRAQPDALLVGETTRLSIRVRAVCAAEQPNRHIVLILDGSGSMAGAASPMMKNLARELVLRLDPAGNPGTRIAVIELTAGGTLLRCPLTESGGRTLACIDQIGALGEASIAEGISAGLTLLRKGRVLAMGPLLEDLMILSDGADRRDCAPMERAALQARSQAMRVLAACLGPNCDPVCLTRVAKSPTNFFQSGDPSAIPRLAQGIYERIVGASIRNMAVVAFLSPDVDYLPNSAVPAATIQGNDEFIEWKLEDLSSADEPILSFEVRALRPGFQMATTWTVTEFRDVFSRSAAREFPPIWINAFGPTIRSTPTP
jgi:hypothetical protein